jgi:hypothetical protein
MKTLKQITSSLIISTQFFGPVIVLAQSNRPVHSEPSVGNQHLWAHQGLTARLHGNVQPGQASKASVAVVSMYYVSGSYKEDVAKYGKEKARQNIENIQNSVDEYEKYLRRPSQYMGKATKENIDKVKQGYAYVKIGVGIASALVEFIPVVGTARKYVGKASYMAAKGLSKKRTGKAKLEVSAANLSAGITKSLGAASKKTFGFDVTNGPDGLIDSFEQKDINKVLASGAAIKETDQDLSKMQQEMKKVTETSLDFFKDGENFGTLVEDPAFQEFWGLAMEREDFVGLPLLSTGAEFAAKYADLQTQKTVLGFIDEKGMPLMSEESINKIQQATRDLFIQLLAIAQEERRARIEGSLSNASNIASQYSVEADTTKSKMLKDVALNSINITTQLLSLAGKPKEAKRFSILANSVYQASEKLNEFNESVARIQTVTKSIDDVKDQIKKLSQDLASAAKGSEEAIKAATLLTEAEKVQGQLSGSLEALGKLSPVSKFKLTTDFISLGLSLTMALMDTGPSPEQMILDGIAEIRKDIDYLSRTMAQEFKNVDTRLVAIHTDMIKNFDHLHSAMQEANFKLDIVVQNFSALNTRLDRIEESIWNAQVNIGERIAEQTLSDCHKLRQHNAFYPEETQKVLFADCLSQISDVYLGQFSSDKIALKTLTDDLNLAEMTAGLSEDTSEANGFLARLAGFVPSSLFTASNWVSLSKLRTHFDNLAFERDANLGVDDFMAQSGVSKQFQPFENLPNQTMWITGSTLAIEALENNPELRHSATPDSLNVLLDQGIKIQSFYRALVEPEIGLENKMEFESKKNFWNNLVSKLENAYENYTNKLKTEFNRFQDQENVGKFIIGKDFSSQKAQSGREFKLNASERISYPTLQIANEQPEIGGVKLTYAANYEYQDKDKMKQSPETNTYNQSLYVNHEYRHQSAAANDLAIRVTKLEDTSLLSEQEQNTYNRNMETLETILKKLPPEIVAAHNMGFIKLDLFVSEDDFVPDHGIGTSLKVITEVKTSGYSERNGDYDTWTTATLNETKAEEFLNKINVGGGVPSNHGYNTYASPGESRPDAAGRHWPGISVAPLADQRIVTGHLVTTFTGKRRFKLKAVVTENRPNKMPAQSVAFEIHVIDSKSFKQSQTNQSLKQVGNRFVNEQVKAVTRYRANGSQVFTLGHTFEDLHEVVTRQDTEIKFSTNEFPNFEKFCEYIEKEANQVLKARENSFFNALAEAHSKNGSGELKDAYDSLTFSYKLFHKYAEMAFQTKMQEDGFRSLFYGQYALPTPESMIMPVLRTDLKRDLGRRSSYYSKLLSRFSNQVAKNEDSHEGGLSAKQKMTFKMLRDSINEFYSGYSTLGSRQSLSEIDYRVAMLNSLKRDIDIENQILSEVPAIIEEMRRSILQKSTDLGNKKLE